jgi:hypothetical protein
MSIPRVVALSLLSLVCVATLAAQDSKDFNLVAPPLQTKLLGNPFQEAPVDSFKMEFSPALASNSANPFVDFSLDKSSEAHGTKRHVDVDSQNDVFCLSMRTYRVKRENPESDAVTPAGYTTCQPAKRFQLKSAVERSEPVPR